MDVEIHCLPKVNTHLVQNRQNVLLIVRNQPQTAAPAAPPHLPTVAATGNSNNSLTTRLFVQQCREGASEGTNGWFRVSMLHPHTQNVTFNSMLLKLGGLWAVRRGFLTQLFDSRTGKWQKSKVSVIKKRKKKKIWSNIVSKPQS